MVFRQVLSKIQLSSGEVAVNAFNQKTTKRILFVLFLFPLPCVFLFYYYFMKNRSHVHLLCLHVCVFHKIKEERGERKKR